MEGKDEARHGSREPTSASVVAEPTVYHTPGNEAARFAVLLWPRSTACLSTVSTVCLCCAFITLANAVPRFGCGGSSIGRLQYATGSSARQLGGEKFGDYGDEGAARERCAQNLVRSHSEGRLLAFEQVSATSANGQNTGVGDTRTSRPLTAGGALLGLVERLHSFLSQLSFEELADARVMQEWPRRARDLTDYMKILSRRQRHNIGQRFGLPLEEPKIAQMFFEGRGQIELLYWKARYRLLLAKRRRVIKDKVASALVHVQGLASLEDELQQLAATSRRDSNNDPSAALREAVSTECLLAKVRCARREVRAGFLHPNSESPTEESLADILETQDQRQWAWTPGGEFEEDGPTLVAISDRILSRLRQGPHVAGGSREQRLDPHAFPLSKQLIAAFDSLSIRQREQLEASPPRGAVYRWRWEGPLSAATAAVDEVMRVSKPFMGSDMCMAALNTSHWSAVEMALSVLRHSLQSPQECNGSVEAPPERLHNVICRLTLRRRRIPPRFASLVAPSHVSQDVVQMSGITWELGEPPGRSETDEHTAPPEPSFASPANSYGAQPRWADPGEQGSTCDVHVPLAKGPSNAETPPMPPQNPCQRLDRFSSTPLVSSAAADGSAQSYVSQHHLQSQPLGPIPCHLLPAAFGAVRSAEHWAGQPSLLVPPHRPEGHAFVVTDESLRGIIRPLHFVPPFDDASVHRQVGFPGLPAMPHFPPFPGPPSSFPLSARPVPVVFAPSAGLTVSPAVQAVPPHDRFPLPYMPHAGILVAATGLRIPDYRLERGRQPGPLPP